MSAWVDAGRLLLVAGLVAVLAATVLPLEPAGLAAPVAEELEASGVAHGVTAVLLNFRAYDTWLEVGVLFVALVGLFALRPTGVLPHAPPRAVSVLFKAAVGVLAPVAGIAAAYMLWRGTHAPGGAFQAGAVLGATFVLLRLAGWRSVGVLVGWRLRACLLAGFAAFLLFALVSTSAGAGLLAYPPALAGVLVVALEVAVAATTAVTLAALYVSGEVE